VPLSFKYRYAKGQGNYTLQIRVQSTSTKQDTFHTCFYSIHNATHKLSQIEKNKLTKNKKCKRSFRLPKFKEDNA